MEPSKDEPKPPTQERLERKKLWNIESTKLDRYDIDYGIWKLVVTLNAIGCHTAVSCEGHDRELRLLGTLDGNHYFRWEHPYVAFWTYPIGEKRGDMRALQILIDDFNKDRQTDPQAKIILTEFPAGNTQLCAGIGKIGLSSLEKWREEESGARSLLYKQKREMREFSEYLEEKYLDTGVNVHDILSKLDNKEN